MSEQLNIKSIAFSFKEAEAMKILPNKENIFLIGGKIFIKATPYYRRKLNNENVRIFLKNISIANCSNFPHFHESYGTIVLDVK